MCEQSKAIECKSAISVIDLQSVMDVYLEIFSKIHDCIVKKDDWRYLDVFLFASIPVFRLKHATAIKTSFEVMEKLSVLMHQGEVIDTNGCITSKFCCDKSSIGRKSWTPHILAGIVLNILLSAKGSERPNEATAA